MKGLTIGDNYVTIEGCMRYFDIYSIDKKITNVDGSHRLEKRTETPLSLMEATKIASEYSRRGHVVEFRKVSQET